jgi:hypothetical protein
MAVISPTTPLRTVIADERAREIFARYLPDAARSPHLEIIGDWPFGRYLAFDKVAWAGDAVRDAFWAELATVEVPDPDPAPEVPAIEPDPAYEGDDVPRASAVAAAPASAERWGVYEIEIAGPRHGNPFVDVELTARFTGPGGGVQVGGFYDGDGTYRIRFMPTETGGWSWTTTSTARSLDGLSGAFEATPAGAGNHGPVRVRDTFHFGYADGTPHVSTGTTAYAWTHQTEALEEQTLRTLASTSFNKIRMCVFPKYYIYNNGEPPRRAFELGADGEWDWTRFDPEFFRHLETRVGQLRDLGVEADLILFHSYDRWGYSKMPRAVDDRYLRYLVRRLAAYRNVWWSMANEYDLMWSKDTDDWERLAQIVRDNDPFSHLHSIHNCQDFYDYSRPWVTHASIQRQDPYRTAENVDEWRRRWGKPVVIDEVGYEGDIDQGWGNLTAQELVRRYWEGTVRGGYVGHGETYFEPHDLLWWSKGGELVGQSPARIDFLARTLAEVPGAALDPLPPSMHNWDLPLGRSADGSTMLGYFGFMQPRFRTVALPPGEWEADVIDTWEMTVEPSGQRARESIRLDLPAKPYIAVRLRRVGE